VAASAGAESDLHSQEDTEEASAAVATDMGDEGSDMAAWDTVAWDMVAWDMAASAMVSVVA
jgi:hypothetical protein